LLAVCTLLQLTRSRNNALITTARFRRNVASLTATKLPVKTVKTVKTARNALLTVRKQIAKTVKIARNALLAARKQIAKIASVTAISLLRRSAVRPVTSPVSSTNYYTTVDSAVEQLVLSY